MTAGGRTAARRGSRARGQGGRAARGRRLHDVWLPVVAVAVLAVALRAPSLLEPHHYSDEGIFAAVAQRLLQGHPLYAGAWDDKPPLVYWLYAGVLAATGPSMVALRAVAALWAAATGAGVTVLGRRWAGPRWGTAAGALCAVLLASPFIEGNLALTELFASAPVIWGFVLLTGGGASRWRRVAAAGALFAVGALFKQVAALDGAAALCYLLLHGRPGIRRAAAIVLGAALPVGMVALMLAAWGGLRDAPFAIAGFYGVYLREGSGLPPLFSAIKLVPAVLAILVAAWSTRRRVPRPEEALALWLGFATLGAALAARPFGHYLVQVVAPASLALAVVGRGIWGRGAAGVAGLAAVGAASALVLASAFSGFWFSYPAVRPAYYAATVQYLTARRSRASYDRFFSWRVANQDRLAAIIRADPERTLFVWGEYPWLYVLADAENPTRYETSYHTSFVPGAKAEVLATLRRSPPRYIVFERDEWRRLPGLAELLANRYERVTTVDNADLFRRIDRSAVLP